MALIERIESTATPVRPAVTSPRYFTSYRHAGPMEEIDEATARASGTYVVQDVGAMGRFRRIADNRLEAVVYAGWKFFGTPLGDFLSLGVDVGAEIYSPVELCDDGGYRWRVWYVGADGFLTKHLEQEYAANGELRGERLWVR